MKDIRAKKKGFKYHAINKAKTGQKPYVVTYCHLLCQLNRIFLFKIKS